MIIPFIVASTLPASLAISIIMVLITEKQDKKLLAALTGY